MFANLFNLGAALGNLTLGGIRRIRFLLFRAVFLAFLLIVLMLVINVMGHKSWNGIVFILGVVFITAQVTRPALLGASAVVGGVVARLGDRDVSQGTIEGLQFLYRITIGALAGFWIVAGFLATWSFAESPQAFFGIMACVIGLTVTMAAFKIPSGKTVAYIVIVYTLAIMVANLWQTLTPGQKAWFPQIASGTGSSQSTPWFSSSEKSVEHPVPLSWKPVGAKVIIKQARPNDEFVISLENANVDQTGGKVFGACAKVVRPELPPEMVVSFENVLGSGTNVNVTKITEKSQVALFAYMKQQGYEGVNMTIEFTKTLKERGARICAND